MRNKALLITLSLFAICAQAKNTGENHEILSTAYSNGISFLMDSGLTTMDMSLSISGPDDVMFTRTYAQSEEAFFEVTDSHGVSLKDGLYKFEAYPVPAASVVAPREFGMPVADRNMLHGKTDAKVSRSGGTFRVLNGQLVDSELTEIKGGFSSGSEQ